MLDDLNHTGIKLQLAVKVIIRFVDANHYPGQFVTEHGVGPERLNELEIISSVLCPQASMSPDKYNACAIFLLKGIDTCSSRRFTIDHCAGICPGFQNTILFEYTLICIGVLSE